MQWLDRIKKLIPAKNKTEYFLVLILGNTKIQALIFGKQNMKAEILGRAGERLGKLLDTVSQDELAQVADRVISSAEENLPPNVFTSKTILCLMDDWVEEGSIKKEYLSTLRKLKDTLELEFIGFVVLTEATSHFLQKEEGVPITAILVSRQGDNLVVTLVRGGKFASQVIRKIEEEDLSQVLASSLRTFKEYEVLPTRIVLFGEGNLEEIKQELISFPWTKTLPFLHLPKIEVLDDDFIERAVTSGFATQMGVEFDKLANEEPITTPPVQRLKFPKVTLPNIKSLNFSNLKFSSPSINSFKMPSFRSRAIYIILAPAFTLFLLILIYIFATSATVTFNVNLRSRDFTRDLTIDSNGATDFATNKIKANPVEIEVSDSQKELASGKKELGEKASGEVTIYNSSTSSQTFPSGTTITGPNNLKFTLDEKVVVASASGDVFSGISPSKAKVKVTATALGEESNFPSNTTFTIGSQTQVAAKNDTAFSGGSKKEVTVVSKKDQDNLTKTLLDKLQEQAGQKISANTAGKEKIVDAALTSEIIEKKFSKQVDEEANDFSLSLKVKFKTLSFNEEDLKKELGSLINQEAGDFNLKQDSLTVSLTDARVNKNKSISAKANVHAQLTPKIDSQSIKKKIKGKNADEAFKILSQIPNVEDYKIKATPAWPLLPVRIPYRIENIKIIIHENG